VALLAAVFVSGCAGDHSSTGRASGRRPSTPPARATAEGPAPAPPIAFTTASGFRYTFTSTGAGFSPTGGPTGDGDPLPPGLTYLVVNGRLTNAQTDRPAPVPGDALTADPSGIGVTIPLKALAAVTTPDQAPSGRDTCVKITLNARFGGEIGWDVAGGRCLFDLDLSAPSSSGDGATITAAGSVQAVYLRQLPEKLPLDQIHLVGYKVDGRHDTITSEYPVPWNAN
jgi:hypothetical protein